jgi:rhodanese-related sulfurtransferase
LEDIQIEPKELKEKLDKGAPVLVVDIREPCEAQVCAIAGSKLVPMNTLPANLAILSETDDVVIYCHHGVRSLNAVAWLRSQGVGGARSLAGGIERWATEIDPTLAHY